MAVAPLLNLPNSSCVASVVMSLSRVVAVTESPYTLGQQAFKWPGERWSVSFRMPTITNRATASDWISFALKLEGRYGNFLLGDPSAKKPRGVATGNPIVNGVNQSGNIISTSQWSPNVQGILLKGDYIQLGSGASSRLHMVVEDANSNGAGIASLTIVPALRSSPANGSPIVTNEPKGVFRLNADDFSWSVSPGPQYQLSFEATEVL